MYPGNYFASAGRPREREFSNRGAAAFDFTIETDTTDSSMGVAACSYHFGEQAQAGRAALYVG
jgi:hypothetical protein